MPLFRSFILRRLATERLRSALTIAGVALGIAVVVAIRLANESSVTGFAAALDAMTGAASLEIVGPAGGLDELRLADIAMAGALRAREPGHRRRRACAIPPAPEDEAVRVLGVDILRDRPFRQYELLEYAKGSRQPAPQEFLVAPERSGLGDPHGAFARRHGLAVGDAVELDIGDVRRRMVVRGLLDARGPRACSTATSC